MANEKILVIDDSADILTLFSEHLKAEGYDVDTSADGSSAIAMIDKKSYDLIFTDLKMPGVDGMAVLEYAMDHSPDSICIILTGYGTVKNAVEAIKRGAFDYLPKPVKMDEILVTIQRALDYRNLKRENLNLRSQLKKKYRFENIIGDHERMQKVFEVIEKVADTDSTILILGESGTGKELIAKAIHYNGPRKDKPFVKVNCAALNENLLESELFGHVKGAFTGAERTRVGRFEAANTGAIFLDEIGDLPLATQTKLLRVLQEKEFERVGDNRPIATDVRILAATNKDLNRLMQEGIFREDLYYRINVIPIYLPPLRNRRDDIPLLADTFIHRMSLKTEKPITGIAKDALDVFMQYGWPGNIRELLNVIEYAFVLCPQGEISLSHLPAQLLGHHPLHGQQAPGLGVRNFAGDKRQELIRALKTTGGNKSEAARRLGISRVTLWKRIKKFGIEIDRQILD